MQEEQPKEMKLDLASLTLPKPTRSSKELYPQVPELDNDIFRLKFEGHSKEDYSSSYEKLLAHLTKQMELFLGYQDNEGEDFTHIAPFLKMHLNNIGDPFTQGDMSLNTKILEREVLDRYACLWRAKYPHDPEDHESYWGYTLSMGSTEGNLYALYNARDYLQGKALLHDPESEEDSHSLMYHKARPPKKNPNAYKPVVFYSEDTHYSLIKGVRTLDVPSFYEVGMERYPHECPLPEMHGEWPVEVPSEGGSLGPGSVDIDKLAMLVEFFASKGHPIIICFNFGTTFKGAYDNIEGAAEKLIPILKKYGLYERKVKYASGHHHMRTGFWFHVDGALGAGYMPLLEIAKEQGMFDHEVPKFDFRLPYVHSIVMSGHKWIGAPWPTGVFMSRVKMQLRPPAKVQYIGAPDTTFAGSRNGHSAMVLWDYHARHSLEDQVFLAVHCQKLTEYAYNKLRELQASLDFDIYVARSPLSLTVRFRKANKEIGAKHSLSNEDLMVDGVARPYSHIFCMAHTTEAKIDALIEDLQQPGAFVEIPAAQKHKKNETDAGRIKEKKEGHKKHHNKAIRMLHVPGHSRGYK